MKSYGIQPAADSTLDDVVILLQQIATALSLVPDSSGRFRTNITSAAGVADTLSNVTTVGTVSTVTGVTTVSTVSAVTALNNIVAIGGLSAVLDQIYSGLISEQTLRSRITT